MRKSCSNCCTRRRCASRRGFTLLELLLVLSILVVVGGIVMYNIGGAQSQANAQATEAQANNLKNAVQMYQIRVVRLPSTLEELRDGPSDSALQAKWQGLDPIITEIPTDAWGNPYEYSVNGNEYEIRSGGRDGQTQTDDDIVVTGP